MEEIQRRPKIPPYEACLGCWRGDTITEIVIAGERTELGVLLRFCFGWPAVGAMAEALNTEPFEVEEIAAPLWPVRICAECARRIGTVARDPELGVNVYCRDDDHDERFHKVAIV